MPEKPYQQPELKAERADAPGIRTDRVELHGGIVHLPAEFREIARLANQAGLEGWKFVDAEVGLDVPNLGSDPNGWGSRVLISYEATPDAGFLEWISRYAPLTMAAWRSIYAQHDGPQWAAEFEAAEAEKNEYSTAASALGDGLAGVAPPRTMDPKEGT